MAELPRNVEKSSRVLQKLTAKTLHVVLQAAASSSFSPEALRTRDMLDDESLGSDASSQEAVCVCARV